MQDFNAYRFFLCLFVFSALTAIFTWMVIYVIKTGCKLIRLGAYDEKLKIEYQKMQAKKESKFVKVMDKVVLAFFTLIFTLLFAFGVAISIKENDVVENVPSLKVVQSGSMSYVNEYNKYVKKGEVESIQVFDLIVINKLPKAEDLKINDVVLYELEGYLLVHRIVGIELPNSEHPDEIHFLLHGDANEFPDKFPVKYSQMKGIYQGERIPYIGSFVNFLQSPAGYLCMLLVVFAVIAVPFAEKKIDKVKFERLVEIGYVDKDGNIISQPLDEEPNEMLKWYLEEVRLLQDEEMALTSHIYHTEPAKEDVVKSEVKSEDEPIVGDVEDVEVSPDKLWYEALNAGKTFSQKLKELSPIMYARYKTITDFIGTIDKVKCRNSCKHVTYKVANKKVAKLKIIGKTLNVFINLQPKMYVDTKYKFSDVSDKVLYADYPMRVKVTSDRQAKWTVELILKCVEDGAL